MVPSRVVAVASWKIVFHDEWLFYWQCNSSKLWNMSVRTCIMFRDVAMLHLR